MAIETSEELKLLKEFNDFCDLITPYNIKAILKTINSEDFFILDEYMELGRELKRLETNQQLLLIMLHDKKLSELRIKALERCIQVREIWSNE